MGCPGKWVSWAPKLLRFALRSFRSDRHSHLPGRDSPEDPDLGISGPRDPDRARGRSMATWIRAAGPRHWERSRDVHSTICGRKARADLGIRGFGQFINASWCEVVFVQQYEFSRSHYSRTNEQLCFCFNKYQKMEIALIVRGGILSIHTSLELKQTPFILLVR